MKLTGDPKLTVRVLSPTQTYFEGKAQSVSANNKVGPFDILADHANFFSLLTEGRVSVNGGRSLFELTINRGLIKVTNNTVTLFVDIEPAYATENSV